MLQTPQRAPYSSYILGFKVDAEGVVIVYGNHSGIISERSAFSLEPDVSFQSFLSQISQHTDKLLNIVQAQHLPLPELISISIAGSYNPQQGLIMSSRDFPSWKNEPLKSQFQLLFNLPVHIEKTAKAGALAESLFGVAQDAKDFAFIELGTNISMAVVLNGSLQSPAIAHAGSIGRFRLPHLKSESDDRAPSLNALCSSPGIVAQALAKQSSHWDPETTVYQIINAAKNSDPYAIELLEGVASALGEGLAPYIQLLRPEIFVLGYPLCLAGEFFSEAVFKSAQTATGLGLDEMPRILPSALGIRLPELQALAPAIQTIRSKP